MHSRTWECFEKAMGVEQDIEEAVRLFRRAAEAGNVQGEGELGHCFLVGSGVRKTRRREQIF